MAARLTKEFRDARKFVEFISPIDFRVASFAAYLTGESVPVKNVVLSVFRAFILAHSEAYREGRYTDDEIDFYVKNERAADAIRAFDS